VKDFAIALFIHYFYFECKYLGDFQTTAYALIKILHSSEENIEFQILLDLILRLAKLFPDVSFPKDLEPFINSSRLFLEKIVKLDSLSLSDRSNV
jgi:hypothetical protein